jgi:Disulphide bond corrector protein DsbC
MKLTGFLFFVFAFMAAPSFAQMTEDPTDWKYEVKKKGANEYELVFHVDLKKSWHVWSMHPGGDGYEIAPSFTFDKQDKVKMKGPMTEKGQKTTTKMEGTEGKVSYFAGAVDFIQVVTVSGSAKITGKHTYQVCNDKLCLPPKDRNFVFEVKP